MSRPKRVIELNGDGQQPELKESVDADARWLAKGKNYHFGYRAHVRTDIEDGYIDEVLLKSANEAETHELDKMSKELEGGCRVYADKGYASKKNRQMLLAKGLRDGVMEKASRGNLLSLWQKVKNRLISRKRFVVERAFGTLKPKFKLRRSRYRGRLKTEGHVRLLAFCYNLLKTCNTLCYGVKRGCSQVKNGPKTEFFGQKSSRELSKLTRNYRSTASKEFF